MPKTKPNPQAKSAQATTLEVGSFYEQQALGMLKAKGYELVAQNVNFHKYGELDLVVQKADQLVFVEVRRRASTAFGGALASVTRAKQRKLQKAALMFLANNPKFNQHLSRFDVIAFEADAPVWIQGAF